MISDHRCALCRRRYVVPRDRSDQQPDDPVWMTRLAMKVRSVWPDDSPDQICARVRALTDALAGLGPTRIFTLIECLLEAELDLRSKGW